MSDAVEIEVLGANVDAGSIDQIARVLTDCVDGGASVSFMAPFQHSEAVVFFRDVVAAVARNEAVLIAARRDGQIVGTVQLALDMPPNQPHRAEVRKLLVRRDARRLGIGATLMARLEGEAKRRGRTLLVLDTASGEAERLYERHGWTRAGTIPGYALFPDGRLCDTTIFWKRV
jgi:GNAT superfamily N-acetyltransferase